MTADTAIAIPASLLPLAALRESPTNPRRNYSDAGLAIAQAYGIAPLALAGQAQQSDKAGLPAGGAAREAVTADLFGDTGEADDDQDDEPATPAPAPRPNRPVVKYRCPMTGQTWSGRGLKPKWLAVALEDGRAISEFEVAA